MDIQYPKVVDAYPGSDADSMIAVGLGSGKVVLTSFGSTIISKEFSKRILFECDPSVLFHEIDF